MLRSLVAPLPRGRRIPCISILSTKNQSWKTRGCDYTHSHSLPFLDRPQDMIAPSPQPRRGNRPCGCDGRLLRVSPWWRGASGVYVCVVVCLRFMASHTSNTKTRGLVLPADRDPRTRTALQDAAARWPQKSVRPETRGCGWGGIHLVLDGGIVLPSPLPALHYPFRLRTPTEA